VTFSYRLSTQQFPTKTPLLVVIIRDGLTGLDDWGTASNCYQWPAFS